MQHKVTLKKKKEVVCHMAVGARSPFLGGDTRQASAFRCSLPRDH